MADKPNIVLVHGAWGDGSHWSHVIPALHQAGHHVVAVQNPLTALADDVDRTRKLAESLDGPTILVGHSYGGAVISGAGHAENVAGLVYIAAFAPDEGDSLGSLSAEGEQAPGGANIVPDAQDFLWIKQEGFRESFCQDLDETEALVMAVSQKPFAARCFADAAGAPAWRVKPSWYQVSTEDRMIAPSTQRRMAERMAPRRTIEVATSHASMATRPKEITELILEAAASV